MEEMETITNDNTTYILKVKDETYNLENSDSKQLVLINSPIHENKTPKQLCVSSLYKNKKVLLKETKKSSFKSVNLKRLSNTEKCSEENVKKRSQNHPMNQEPVVLNPTLKIPRRKLSYETVFKPSIPTNRGSINGFIRFGRRQLVVDQQIMINTRQFKEQLTISDDLITPSDLAPRTKREMQRLLTGITKLFAYPAHKIRNSQLLQLYISNCTSNEKPNAESFNDMELMPLGYEPPPPVKSLLKIISRKRQHHIMKLHRPNILERKRYTCITEDQILVEAANLAHDHEYTKQVEVIQEKTEEVTKLVQEKTQEITKIDQEEIPEQVEEKPQEITEVVQEETQEINELVQEKTEELTELIQEEKQEIIELVQEKTEEMTELIREEKQELIELVEEKSKEMTELIQEEHQQITELVQQNIEEIQEKCEVDLLQQDIKTEEDDVFTIKSDELYTIKSDDDSDERQIVIIQRLGENIALSQKNLESLLAAASSDLDNRIVTICKSSDFTDGNGFILVQNDENEQFFETESKFILPD